jgi:hypothetical protein
MSLAVRGRHPLQEGRVVDGLDPAIAQCGWQTPATVVL